MSLQLTSEQLKEVMQGAVTAALQALQTEIPQPSERSQVQRPERPEVDVGVNESQWAFFVNEWECYKRRSSLKPGEVVDELRASCTKELRKVLFDFLGRSVLENITEDDLLEKIKSAAVIGKNKSVHRKEFYTIKQSPGEPINLFVAKLKSKSEHCNFTVKCSSDACNHQVNSYSESMIVDQMTAGILDKDIQEEILARDKQLSTFQERYDLIEAYELGKLAKNQLDVDESHANASKSQYRRNQESKRMGDRVKADSTTCVGCGSRSHQSNERERKCPAWNKKCYNCNEFNHFSGVCPKRKSVFHRNVKNEGRNYSPTSVSMSQDLEESGTSYFFSFSDEIIERFSSPAPALPHVEWDGQKFHRTKPPPLPAIKLDLFPMIAAHRTIINETQIPNDIKCTSAIAFTDTCAQTCIADPSILAKMNVTNDFLLPTSHRIIGVTGRCLDIIGVIMLEMKYNNNVTHNVVYVCKNVKGLFLSIKAQTELGILPHNYPNVNGLPTSPIPSTEVTNICTTVAACGCPLRTSPPERPERIPFPATPENVGKIEKWIIESYSSSAFNSCVHQPLPKMKGKPLDIHFKENVVASAVHTPIPVPHHWKNEVKKDIDRDVNLAIIEPVPQGTPTKWCSRMVIVSKHDGKPRRTVDYQRLNEATLRETHHTPSPFNQASVIPPKTKKTTLDAWNGYHSLPLSTSAKEATTFITEWGRYRYISAPQGFHAAGDGYTRRYDDITQNVERKSKCVDDTILWDSDIESAFWHTIDYINLCNSNGVVFNVDKFHFAKDEVDFAGFTITKDSIKPTEKMLAAIKDFPTPTNITGIRSFFGLVNQVSYTFASSVKMQPFRDLLKKKSTWYWDDTLDTLFQEAKEFVLAQIENGVRTFEVNRPTCLWTDWSKHGIGFSLLQKFCKCDLTDAPTCCKDGYQLVFAGSRFTTDVESRYSPIEGEALAVVNALEKCRMFVTGCPNLIIVVDHKPLIKIFGDKTLESIANPRLLNLKEKTLRYNFTIKHVAGKLNSSADACSRFPVKSSFSSPIISFEERSSVYDVLQSFATQDDVNSALECDNRIEATVLAALTGHDNERNIRLIDFERAKEVSSSDRDINELSNQVMSGFPQKKEDCSPNIQRYWNIRNELSTLGNLVLYGKRIIVPLPLRKEILENLHSAHQGETGMKSRATSCVYWPGITGDIRNRKLQCRDCNDMAPSQPPEPYLTSESPEYPFDKVVSDYFSLHGHKYLLYADRYSGWITIVKPSQDEGDSKYLKRSLRTLFSIYGAPNELSSDGGPPYDSHDMIDFLCTWGVHWRKSSAHYPQSNGRAELAVKVAKRILTSNCDVNGNIDNDLVARALLQYRNTPLQGINLSPAQILYGRMLKDHTPILPELCNIRPEWRLQAEERESALRKRNSKMIERYNRNTRTLPELTIGDHVAVQNQRGTYPRRWGKNGKVVEKLPYRQYRIRMDGSGRITLRNRRFLRAIEPVCSDPVKYRRYSSINGKAKGSPTVLPNANENDVIENEIPLPVTHNDLLPNQQSPPLRRSTRTKEPRKVLQLSHQGKGTFKNDVTQKSQNS